MNIGKTDRNRIIAVHKYKENILYYLVQMMRIVLIFWFSSLTLCGHVAWKKVVQVGTYGRDQVYTLTSPNGDSHFFWQEKHNEYRYYVKHRKISPDGTMTWPKILNQEITPSFSHTSLAGEISDDGKQIIFAFTGLRDGRRDIYFTESLDGGEEWAQPIRVAEKEYRREDPVFFLERDTGRVYLMYDFSLCAVGLAIREPGAKTFNEEIYPRNLRSKSGKYLTQLVDKKTSERVLHLFGDSAYSGCRLDHMKSFDDGKNWTDPHTIASEIDVWVPNQVAAGTEGHFYVQYHEKTGAPSVKAVWTKDYGQTWEPPIEIDDSQTYYNTMVMCGRGSNEKVLCANGKSNSGTGFVKYLKPGETKFKNLHYPFHRVRHVQDLKVSCAYTGNGQYTVAMIMQNYDSRKVFAAYGTAHNL